MKTIAAIAITIAIAHLPHRAKEKPIGRQVTFTRTNLSDVESAGPVHAPFFPVVKHEVQRAARVEGTARPGRPASCD